MVVAIVFRTHKNFGNIKVLVDSSMVLAAVLLSLAVLHTIVGLREGTIISAVLVGMSVRFFSPAGRVVWLRSSGKKRKAGESPPSSPGAAGKLCRLGIAIDMEEREPSGLFCFCVAAEKRTAKDHGCGTVFKVWRNPVLLEENGRTFRPEGRGRASIGGKGEGQKERQRNLSRIFCVFSAC